MKLLFIHQNFPGQFAHLVPALVDLGHEVVSLSMNVPKQTIPGVRHVIHHPQVAQRAVPPRDPLEIADIMGKLMRGESAAVAMRELKEQGYLPDVIFAHPGWGEAWFIRDIFPKARVLLYNEYFYQAEGGDSFFDPEFSKANLSAVLRLRIISSHLVQAMTCADAGLSPTQFQRDRHPAWFKDRIRVIHDGIDTDRFKPDPQARFILQNENIELRSGDEIVTFVVRELEPYRGYHIFMRALPELLRRRPQVSVVIVGGDSVSYGAPPPVGSSWKTIFLNEVKAQLDMSRVHFVGKLAHEKLTQLMQVSTVHAYLTYPFVLSWSMMEAMSIGCLIVGSKTAPVEELIEHGKNGLLTDFFNPQALAETIADALDRKEELAYLGRAARQTIIDRYDLQRICLPAQLDFVLNF